LRIIDFDDHIARELARASFAVQRRWLRRSTVALILLILLSGLIALLVHGAWWPALLLGGLGGLSGACWAYYEWAYRRHRIVRSQLRAGLAGQKLLPQILAGLDDSYYLINNLKLPGRADDVDHLVIGPNGIFALETKHHRGRIFWRNGQWRQAKISRRGLPQPESEIRDPAQQLKRNIDYLRTCINRTDHVLSRRTHLWIEGIVVFTHPAVTLDLPQPILEGLPFPVMRARDLPQHLRRHVPRYPYSKSDIRQIVSLFGHLQPGCPAPNDSTN
jgi:hypothetical protein